MVQNGTCRFLTICLIAGWPAIFGAAGCDDGSDGDGGDGGADTGDTDIDTGSDSMGGDDSDTGSDSEPAGSVFDGVDCAVSGMDPTQCEYEWCRKKQPYEMEQCAGYLDCYDVYFTCMASACPLGGPVPEGDAKSPLYACDNDFTYCTLAATECL